MAQFWFGTNNSDTFFAAGSEDWFIYGYDGDDFLYGADGHDFLQGGDGADVLYGGGGTDTASYSGSAEGVWIDLSTGIGHGYHGSAEGDTLILIDNVTGSIHDDLLIGNDLANQLDGSSGSDTLKGYGGADTLWGGGGNDTASYDTSPSGVVVSLQSGLGSGGDATGDELFSIENLSGSTHDDTLAGDAGRNTLRGRDGDDTLKGFGSGDALHGGPGDDLLYGGDGKDQLNGDSGDDRLFGGNSNDQIYGDSGNDRLSGGLGSDTLTGGGSNTHDVFIFDTALNALTNVDTITDFHSADDVFWLDDDVFSSLPLGTIDDDQFVIGSGATSPEHRIVYNQTFGIVMYDPDGAGRAPAVQFAMVGPGETVQYNDFVVIE